MSIIFAGTPSVAARSLEILLERGITIDVVLTRPDAPVGRKRVMTPSDVANQAQISDIPTLKTAVLDESILHELNGVADMDMSTIRLGVIVAYGGFVREPILSLPELGWINLHFSDLPQYRGAAPVQRSLFDGNQTTALTVFQLDEHMDAGPILSRQEVEYLPDETADEALSRFAEIGAELLVTTIELLLEGNTNAQEQVGEITFAPKFQRGEEILTQAMTAETFMYRFRGLTAEPGAVLEFRGSRIKILSARSFSVPNMTDNNSTRSHPTDVFQTHTPGDIIVFEKKILFTVLDGFVELLTVQPAGRKTMPAADWWRGISQTTQELS